MLADPAPVSVDERPGGRLPSGTLAERVAVVAPGHEADLLALRLLGGDQAVATGDVADFGLGQLAEGEPAVARADPGAGRRGSSSGPCPRRRPLRRRKRRPSGDLGVVDRVDPGVVPGRDGLAVIQPAGASGEGAELDRAVAVDAGTRRLAVEVGVEEGLQHAGPELPLEVEDVERDAELAGHASSVLGRVERAAALLELAVGVGDVMEAHPDADRVQPLLVEDDCRDRRIDPAGHGHEDPPGPVGDHRPVARHGRRDRLGAQTPISWPNGSAASAVEPSRSRAMTAGTTSTA